MTNRDAQIHTLHRYFLWANRLREHFNEAIQLQGPPPEDKRKLLLWSVGPFGYFSLWMAMLYVVIEGWQDLELSDDAVQRLLDPERIASLKRYRNGVTHFQKTYFDRRYTEFTDAGVFLGHWADDLHEELSRFFLSWFDSRGYVTEQ